MQRFSYPGSFSRMRQQILQLTSKYTHFSVLDSCAHVDFENNPVNYKLIAGFGLHKFVSCDKNWLNEMDAFVSDESNNRYWKFGFLSYDLKNEIEHLSSTNPDAINFPLLHFFIPETVIV